MAILSSSHDLRFNSDVIVREHTISPQQHKLAPYYAQTLEFYERLASLYDLLYPDHLRFSEQLFSQLSPILAEAGTHNVLDASCGVGHDMLSLLRLGFRVEGIDISKRMIEEADRRLRRAGFDGMRLHVGDASSLQTVAPQDAYDLVVSRGNTFSNIHPDDFGGVVKQLLSIVRPGGLLLADYRDGEHQLAERKGFEFRGSGIARERKALFWSNYVLKHSDSLLQPYEVCATVRLIHLRHMYSVERLHIRSHYVDAQRLLETIRHEAIQELRIPTVDTRGLPYLQTVLVRRAS